MMMLLDRYLLRQYVQIFLICFVSMMGLYAVIDVFGHLEQFSSYAEGRGTLMGVIAEYYAYRSVGFFDRAGAMLAVIAAIFTATWLQRHEELTAMLAAGISKVRIVRPLVLATIVVSLLGVANREWLIPMVRDELARDSNDLQGTEARDLEPRFDGKTDILIGGQKTIASEQRIVGPTFILPNRLAKYDKKLIGRNAYYQEANELHPSGYLIDGVTTPAGIDDLASLELDQQAIIITPRDANWLKPGQAFVVSQVPFPMLAGGSTWRHYASTGELIEALGRPSSDLGADVRVAVHTRLTQPISDVTLLMLGLPLMFSSRKHNVFYSIGLCLVVVLTFFLTTLACQSMGGLNLLRPTLAAWLPILIFLPIAVGVSQSLKM